MKSIIRTIVRLGAVLMAAAPAAAAEVSLTGTYEGFFVCDHIAAGEGGGFGRAMTMEIVQSDDRIAMRNTVAVDPSGPPSHTLFRGRVATGSGGTVSGYAEVCDSTFPHKELVRIAPASPSREPFSFAADTVFVSEAVPGIGDRLVVETCKWALTRVSAATPQFAACR